MMSKNQAANYLRASLHRAINEGAKSLTVSALDLKDALAELEALQTHQDASRPTAPLVGWANPNEIQQMRQGQRRGLTVSRKKSGSRTQQVCASVSHELDKATQKAAEPGQALEVAHA